MAPNDSTETTAERGRRRATRYVVPVAVAGVAAATIGLVPALAASGDPELPDITAQQLIEKIAASDTQTLSGTVKVSTDLGLPSLAGLAGLAGSDSGSGKPSTDPTAKLTELVSGSHTLKVAADGPEKQRLTFLEGQEEYSLIHNGDDVWAYDSKANEAVHEKDADGPKDGPKRGHEKSQELPSTPKALADEVLKAADKTTSVTVGGTARVAGRDAYQLVVKPKQSGSTVESIKIAVDAQNGVPLKFTLASTSGGKAVLDAGFTKVDFGKPAASTFQAPKGAKVTEGAADKAEHEGRNEVPKELEGLFGDLGPKQGGKGGLKDGGPVIIGEGWTTIAKIDSGAPAPKTDDAPKEMQGFLDSLGDEVHGKFGSGTVFKTKIVNALITDNGTVYVGAVTPDALVKAANAAK
ncbi:LolA family protein [Streptomyces sp.]|uniref:LolA family protein n=1 Tax=Streptomyces sp. TaxID=1931 RepID=UPI002F954B48